MWVSVNLKCSVIWSWKWNRIDFLINLLIIEKNFTLQTNMGLKNIIKTQIFRPHHFLWERQLTHKFYVVIIQMNSNSKLIMNRGRVTVHTVGYFHSRKKNYMSSAFHSETSNLWAIPTVAILARPHTSDFMYWVNGERISLSLYMLLLYLWSRFWFWQGK